MLGRFEGYIRSKISSSVCSNAEAWRTNETETWGVKDPQTERTKNPEKGELRLGDRES